MQDPKTDENKKFLKIWKFSEKAEEENLEKVLISKRKILRNYNKEILLKWILIFEKTFLNWMD